jgi:hypothetical protein
MDATPMIWRWAYLEHEAYRARHAMAAWFLRNCQLIIDIGCGATPLQPWCSQPVISISPDLPARANGFCGTVEEWSESVRPGYGVCVLGCDLQTADAIKKVRGLLDNATAAVIEAALEWPPSVDAATKLMQGRSVKYSIDLNLSSVPIDTPDDSWPPRPLRRIWVL